MDMVRGIRLIPVLSDLPVGDGRSDPAFLACLADQRPRLIDHAIKARD
jgi:hypothetical protein